MGYFCKKVIRMKTFVKAFLAVMMIPACSAQASQGDTPQPESKVSVQRIWDKDYSAFPSLETFKGAYYVSFREGESHIFDSKGEASGKVRILRSTDGETWEPVALLGKDGFDLRDPHLSVTPDGRLMILMGGSIYRDQKLTGKIPHVSFSSDGKTFSDPEPVVYEPNPAATTEWFWRLTWNGDTGYTASYGSGKLLLLKTKDGIHYSLVTQLGIDGAPNETTLRFLPDGRMLLLARRETSDKFGCWGVSRPPYTDWDFKLIGFRIGGPDFLTLEDGTVIAGGRAYLEKANRMRLWKGDLDGRFEVRYTLPSGGDNSYPGLLKVGDELWVVYYSSHELTTEDGTKRAGIYFAKLPISLFED